MSRAKSIVVLGFAIASALTAAACSDAELFGGRSKSDQPGDEEATQPKPDYENPRTKESEELPDPLEGLPKGRASVEAICSRGERNPVTGALCNGRTLTSIVDLQEALDLGFQDKSARGQNAS